MKSMWYEIPQISECFWEVLWLYGKWIIEDIHTGVWVGYPAGVRMSEAGSEGRNRLGEAGLEAWEKVLSFPELISWNSLSRSSKRNHGNKLAKCPLLKPGNLFSFKRWETCRVLKCVLDVSRAQQQWAQAISQAWVREQCGFWRILRLIRAKGIVGTLPWQLASNSQSANTDAPPGFPFASFLYNLFLSWSNRLLPHCGLGLSLNIIFTLAHSLLQLQTPEPGQQTQQEFVLIGARLLQHQEDLQLLRDIMWQLWFCMGQCTGEPVCLHSVSVRTLCDSEGPVSETNAGTCGISTLVFLVLKNKGKACTLKQTFYVSLLMDVQALKFDSSHFLSMVLHAWSMLASWPSFLTMLSFPGCIQLLMLCIYWIAAWIFYFIFEHFILRVPFHSSL